MGLIDALGAGPVALDTAIFIYFIEANARYRPLVTPIFERIDQGQLLATTSAITLLETLVVPFRAGHHPLAEAFEQILRNSAGLRMVDIDLPVLRAAAMLRATTGCRMPDAIQLASAISTGCSCFLTNDRRIRGPRGIRVIQLDDYLTA